jgi:hypothetical protein
MASARLAAPSFVKMAERFCPTLSTLMPRVVAISGEIGIQYRSVKIGIDDCVFGVI